MIRQVSSYEKQVEASCLVSELFYINVDCRYDTCLAGACSGPCNQSFCKAGILGWLEDGSPPWRLLIPLWWPHLAHDQFQIPLGVRVAPGAVWLSLGPLSDQI